MGYGVWCVCVCEREIERGSMGYRIGNMVWGMEIVV